MFYIQNIGLYNFEVSTCFQNVYTYYFFCSQESKFSTLKEIYFDQVSFPHKKNLGKFSTKTLFTWPGKYSIKKYLGKLFTKQIFPWKGKFSTKKDISLIREVFLWLGKFCTKKDLRKFSTKNIFPWSKKFSRN